jgi:hypothetical protein
MSRLPDEPIGGVENVFTFGASFFEISSWFGAMA